MKYVLDSSVALKWVLPEPDVSKAVQLRDDYHNGVHELLAPDIFPVETLHALTKAERRQRIAPANGWTLWQSLLADAPAMHSHLSLLGRAYQIASAARIGVYDCLYVALAEQEGCELITADGRLVASLQARFPFIRDLASLP